MTCIDRRPDCGAAGDPVAGPLSKFASGFLTIFGLIGFIGSAIGALSKVSVTAGVITVGGLSVSSVGAAVVVGFATAVAVLVLVALYADDRCVQGRGRRQCVAGVVETIVNSFSSGWEDILPFTAMHDRVDVVVKSRFWDVVESRDPTVFCTDDDFPRQSELMRCYYYDDRVCRAARGAVIGAAVGGAAGIVAAAAAVAAIGCAAVITCLLALALAGLIVAAAALAGALAGGQIAKAAAEDDRPSTSGGAIVVGDLISVNGQIQQRENDENANVFWWVSSTAPSSRVSDELTQPFSYCEIDDEFPVDGCAI